jgi:Prokaryotic Cytochrome C oxidase subunit IV
MRTDPILRAWLSLLVLSAASVVAALVAGMGFGESVVGVLVLLFAWMKARVILARYLGLWQAPSWQSGFNWVLGLFCLLLLGLYLAPVVMV